MPEAVPGTSLEYFLVAFDENGVERKVGAELTSVQLGQALSRQPYTDVFIFSHGWMTDVPSAKQEFPRWIKAMADRGADIAEIERQRREFKPLLVGLHWPSMPFGNEDLGQVSFGPGEDLLEQLAQQTATTPRARQALDVIVNAAAQEAAPPQLPSEVREAYRVLAEEVGVGLEGLGGAPGNDGEPFDPDVVYMALQEEVSFGGAVEGILAPIRVLSFWSMKGRAREIGMGGAHKLLNFLQLSLEEEREVRFHLMGHSFGCIVVSAMVGTKALAPLPRAVNSVFLVQGALSIWSYARNIPHPPGGPGFFHALTDPRRVQGPILATYSGHDSANGTFYPLGAGSANQLEFGPGEGPKFGALGSHGIQGDLDHCTCDELPMKEANQPYGFKLGAVYNLDGAAYIGGHSDFCKPEVAHAFWQAVMATLR